MSSCNPVASPGSSVLRFSRKHIGVLVIFYLCLRKSLIFYYLLLVPLGKLQMITLIFIVVEMIIFWIVIELTKNIIWNSLFTYFFKRLDPKNLLFVAHIIFLFSLFCRLNCKICANVPNTQKFIWMSLYASCLYPPSWVSHSNFFAAFVQPICDFLFVNLFVLIEANWFL